MHPCSGAGLLLRFLAVLNRGFLIMFLKTAVEMAEIKKAGLFCYLFHGQPCGGQQPDRMIETQLLKGFRKRFAGILLDQAADIVFRITEFLCNLL